MRLLISDANILIDLEEGGLLVALFKLPYRFSVPDILFYEELEEQHPHLGEMGLGLLELTPSSMRYAFDLIQRSKGAKPQRLLRSGIGTPRAMPIAVR